MIRKIVLGLVLVNIVSMQIPKGIAPTLDDMWARLAGNNPKPIELTNTDSKHLNAAMNVVRVCDKDKSDYVLPVTQEQL